MSGTIYRGDLMAGTGERGMSKGSRQRPTDKDKFDREFERIFGKPKPADTKPGG